MNIFQTFKYIQYMLISRHMRGHGIHSPFIFDLVSRVFRNKTDEAVVNKIEKIRKKLISDCRSIIVNDLGSGSVKMKTDLRKVSHIAKYSPVPLKYGTLLSNLASEFGKPDIIELGTSFGISTMYMAASCPEAVVYTIEGCQSIAEIAGENFREAGINNIRLLTGPFDDMLSKLTIMEIKPGLIFIDGNHRKEPVLEYFNRLVEISDNNTVIVVDDICYSQEMQEAWKVIIAHNKVTASIDLFRMGIVFLRKGITRGDYIVRH